MLANYQLTKFTSTMRFLCFNKNVICEFIKGNIMNLFDFHREFILYPFSVLIVEFMTK